MVVSDERDGGPVRRDRRRRAAAGNGNQPKDRPVFGSSPGENVAYMILQGEQQNDQAGISVAGVGDVVAGLSYDEFAIGTGVGKAYLQSNLPLVKFPKLFYICGDGEDGFKCVGPYEDWSDPGPTQVIDSLANAYAVFEDTRPNTFLGRTVAGPGDVSGAGSADLALSAPRQLEFETQSFGAGEVHLFFGE